MKQRVNDGSIQIESDTIYQTWPKNYQGLDAPAGYCLGPFVESKLKGLSARYCHCSVGYVKEIFSRTFGKPVSVELVESALRNGTRCKFKIRIDA